MQILFQTLFVLLIMYSTSVVGHWIYFVYCPLSWLCMKLNTADFHGFIVVLISLFCMFSSFVSVLLLFSFSFLPSILSVFLSVFLSLMFPSTSFSAILFLRYLTVMVDWA